MEPIKTVMLNLVQLIKGVGVKPSKFILENEKVWNRRGHLKNAFYNHA